MTAPQTKMAKFKNCLYVSALTILYACALALCGCAVLDVVELAKPENPPDYDQIARCYRLTQLKVSSSADVLTVIGSGTEGLTKEELMSQSTSVIGVVGQNKKGYRTWLKIVAFDENELTANRKYLFLQDEKPKALFVTPWAYASFECQMVLTTDVLDVPYANENARRIAILQRVRENTRDDIIQLETDNKTFAVCGDIINQGLQTVLNLLESSPALAAELDEPDGLRFEELTYDKGLIKMDIFEDIVSVDMKLGSIIKKRLPLPYGESYEPPLRNQP